MGNFAKVNCNFLQNQRFSYLNFANFIQTQLGSVLGENILPSEIFANFATQASEPGG